MVIIKTGIEGVLILEPTVFTDERGHFFESYSQKEFEERACGTTFIQDNESLSRYGVLRGLHYQLPPHAQSKLVRVVCGKVMDVAVDIRRGSPTFAKYVAAELSDQNKRQLFIPRGFAHGFVVLSEEAVVQYKCDNYYAPRSEGSVIWNDTDIGIKWGIPAREIILSDKDLTNPPLADALTFDYEEILY